MRILVTGGSGFIGTRLVECLQAVGKSVVVYDKKVNDKHARITIQGDVRDAARLSRAMEGAEAVIHLAAEHRDDVTPVSLYDDVNVGGSANVVQAAQATGCRKIIFASSVAVYPLDVAGPTEESEPRPFNPYGESKYRAERGLIRWQGATPGAMLVVVRPCVVFGEGNRGNVYNLLNQIHRKHFIMVGRGRNRKSMAYVGNVAQFLVECLDKPAGFHLFNYADKPDLSVAELLRVANRSLDRNAAGIGVCLPYWAGLLAGWAFDGLAKVSGRKLPVSSIRVRKFCADTTVSTSRLESTGFRRPYSLEEALRRTVQKEFGGC